MARIAFEIDADEDLRRILRGLQGRSLRRADDAAPVDADEEAIRVAAAVGFNSSLTIWSYGLFFSRASSSHGVMLLRPATSEM